jgi:integrase
MSMYVDHIRTPPRTLTEIEQARLLKTTGSHEGFRDHVLFSVALGTGLREHELCALNVGDITVDGASVRRHVTLRVFKKAAKDPAAQEAFLPDALVYKLKKYLRWKAQGGESLAPDAPLFVSRLGRRLATRTVRFKFKLWQERAAFDRSFSFHSLRHSALSNVYRRTHDLRLTQRVARHKAIQTTTIYTLPSDEDVLQATRMLPC